jgi:hypothetical protein
VSARERIERDCRPEMPHGSLYTNKTRTVVAVVSDVPRRLNVPGRPDLACVAEARFVRRKGSEAMRRCERLKGPTSHSGPEPSIVFRSRGMDWPDLEGDKYPSLSSTSRRKPSRMTDRIRP